MALVGRFTEHHALLRRLHLARIAVFDDAVGGLDKRITGKAVRWQREAGLLTSVPDFGDVVAQAWLGEIGLARTGTSPATRSWPAGSRYARGTTSAPANASTTAPGTPGPT